MFIIFNYFQIIDSNATYTLRSGSNYWHKGGSVHKVIQIIPHPLRIDVALMKVNPPFELTKTKAQAVSLPSSGDLLRSGTEVIVTGWGHTYEVLRI